uniref:Uncharacterized protein n=1 Tax=Rhizophora mucronata TaxID=61149 RepID=A0A2P2QPR3_RHIMU
MLTSGSFSVISMSKKMGKLCNTYTVTWKKHTTLFSQQLQCKASLMKRLLFLLFCVIISGTGIGFPYNRMTENQSVSNPFIYIINSPERHSAKYI